MRLTSILQAECVKVPLQADSKQRALDELVDVLAANKLIDRAEELKKAVWDREQTRTTGIGHGIAIPHGKSVGVARLSMAIGRTAVPVDFGAIDGRPVELIFLLASPIDQTGPHIQALARVSRLLTNEQLRHNLKNVESAEQLYQLIVQHETDATT